MKPQRLPSLHRLACTSLLLGIAALCATPARAQTPPASDPVAGPIARIEGDDLTIRGQVNLERVTGHSFAELSSGSEVTVRSRQARIELAAGGEIGVCGPAKFTLLRSGSSVTLALDFGRVHARLKVGQTLTIYTPVVVATPITISGGETDFSAGLGETGKMCVFAKLGAVRVQPQFGDQAVIVPQNIEASLTEGHLDSVATTPGTCQCDALEAFAAPADTSVRIESSVLPVANGADGSSAAQIPGHPPSDVRPATEEPIWKVVMPPLSMDASSRSPQPPKPETILLLREVRVRHGVIFSGSVIPPADPAPATKKESAGSADKTAVVAGAQAVTPKPSFGQRVRNFFRRLFGGKSKSS